MDDPTVGISIKPALRARELVSDFGYVFRKGVAEAKTTVAGSPIRSSSMALRGDGRSQWTAAMDRDHIDHDLDAAASSRLFVAARFQRPSATSSKEME